MSKPLLLSIGSGKVQEFVGNATGQTPVWSEGADEWVLGTPSSSGGGGVTWYLNEDTAAGSPTTNLPTGASGAVVKNLSATADGTSTTVASTTNVPVLPATPELIASFVTDATVPGLTGIPAGLWDFNIWAEANGNTTNQSYVQFKIYKYDGVNAPTSSSFIAESVPVYLYDPADVTQYTASVLIPAGTSLLTTDRIYVEVVGGSTTSNRQITLHFGNGEPSHVHTTINVPVNLTTGVTGTLPVANGGTGVTSASANTVFAGPTSGAAAAPGFRPLVANDIPSLSSTYLPLTGGTLTGKLNTVASASGSAGLNLPHGTAPTSPVNGDLWTTSTGLFVGINNLFQQVVTTARSNTFTAGTRQTMSQSATVAGLSLGAVTGNPSSIGAGDVWYNNADFKIRYFGNATTNTLATETFVSASYAPLASPTFTGSPSLPTGTTGVTQTSGNSSTALATTAFVTTAVAASAGTPYDLPFEIPGTPAPSTKVVNFKAVRAFVLATTGHRGGQLTNPSSNFVCTVFKNATTLGTITFASGGFSSNITATLADRTFAATDVLSVETQSAALGIDTPFATLFMTLA